MLALYKSVSLNSGYGSLFNSVFCLFFNTALAPFLPEAITHGTMGKT